MESPTWSADVPSRLSFMKFVPQGLIATVALGLLPALLTAQDRLRSMPGYERYNRMASQINSSVRSGALSVTWIDSGKALEYTRDG
jgi:dipeptidyl-peptidase-4